MRTYNLIRNIFVLFCLIVTFSCNKREFNELVCYNEYISLNEYIDEYALESNFVIGHASDIHAYRTNWDTNLNKFFNLLSQDGLNGRLNALLLTGDYCEGTTNRAKSKTVNEIKSVFNIVLSQDIPCYAVIGNHDDNIEMARGKIQYDGRNYISKKEQVNMIISPILNKWNPSENNDLGYYKIDFTNNKIRMIFLDFIDYPYEFDENWFAKHNIGFYFSQKQLEWLYKTLLTTPDNFGICIVIHAIPSSDIQFGDYAQDINLLPDIINAYKKGSTFEHNWIHPTLPEYSTHLNFDFSSKGGSEFICYLGGHIHRRKISVIKNYPDQVYITAPCLYTYKTDNLFNIVSINTKTKEIALFCYDESNEKGISNKIIKCNY